MALNLIPAADVQAMDDTEAWALANVVHIKPAPPETPDQCYTALQQSLAHYRSAGRMTAAQAQREHLMLRAQFLRAEAKLMLDEQWEAYGTEGYFDDGYRASRTLDADVSACMDCWQTWDADGYALYQALVRRAVCIEAKAKAVPL